MTLLAILALIFSLGLTTHSFSILNAFFFKPLPFDDPEQLRLVHIEDSRHGDQPSFHLLSYEQFQKLRASGIFKRVSGYYAGTVNLSGKGDPTRYEGTYISPEFLDLLGIEPVLGSGFTQTGERSLANPEILISHSAWVNRYHSDESIIGETIRANGVERIIVGVLPPDFHYPVQADVWIPLEEHLADMPNASAMQLNVIARLRHDQTIAELDARLASLHNEWERAAGQEPSPAITVSTYDFGDLILNSPTRKYTAISLLVVIFILLVACANVANLLVGRALSRGREIAIRSALGASRKRILRELLTESFVLSLFGLVGGLIFAAWAVDLSYSSDFYQIPHWLSFELDWRVFLFAFAVMIGTTVISGIVPAWQASKVDLNSMLKEGSSHTTNFKLGRMTRVLAIIQIAVSCGLLFGAGVMVRHVVTIANSPVGFQTDNVLTMRMGLFDRDYPEESRRDAFYAAMRERVDRLPGVNQAAVTSWISHISGNNQTPFLREEDFSSDGSGLNFQYAYYESVSPGYFQTLGVPIREGRDFIDEDTAASSPVVVVNQAFVDLFLSGRKPIGTEIHILVDKSQTGDDPPARRIVGIVPNIRISNFLEPSAIEPVIYLPNTQVPSTFMTLLCRYDGANEEEIAAAIKQEILKIDPHLPVYFVRNMNEFISEQLIVYKLIANFLVTISMVSLFLAAVGVYGMLAFSVSRRSRELGIRMALGASSRRVVQMILRQGFVQVILGILAGYALGFVIGQIAHSFWRSIDPWDTSVYAAVILIIVATATIAFTIPARRAARLSPMEAIRYE